MGLLGSFKTLLKGKQDVRARYELMRSAISGTMSSFYMARNRETGQVVGLKILDKIEQQDYNVLAKRPYISKLDRLGVLCRTCFSLSPKRKAL